MINLALPLFQIKCKPSNPTSLEKIMIYVTFELFML